MPSFFLRFLRWKFTVTTATPSISAICLLLRPSRTSRATWVSWGVRIRLAVLSRLSRGETISFNCRSMTHSPFGGGSAPFFANTWLWGGVALTIALQLLFTYAPLMNRLFATAPITPADWGRIVLVGVAVFGVIEGEKALRRRGGKTV